MSRLKLFSLDAGADFAGRVAAALGEPLARHEERCFADGEHKVRPLDDVEGADVFLVQSLYRDHCSSVDEKLLRCLFFIGALRDAGAARITAVMPYLCYGRKDRRTKLHDPLPTRYLASLFEAVGTQVVVTLDAHNLAAFENAFRCRTLHLLSESLLLEFALSQLLAEPRPLSVLSPDEGGIKRAEALREALSERLGRPVGCAFVEKYRSGEKISGGTLVGEVQGAVVLVVDDLIASGATLCRAVEAAHGGGAQRILALASHGQFSGDAFSNLSQLPLEAVAVTNSLPQLNLPQSFHLLDCAPLMAEAIRRLHDCGPVSELTL
ncbi:ribose-phosphate diphosphokinase [Microbulbifer variabilis]|jgi:ribose-phosphate pyrophosphokinase|uniref:ribose-phosphate diphosphokinase n=1 Tax=Microbulbifer variabilis TaxID=266805 RepID=A0ABY4VBH7_9GAMM|nr:ribose-phosphate diphosphokinase [Microbulbifer variabilis]USD21616.1 ribose-phosphate diphosphokinase [Microbulbifer variabilis]